MEDNFIFLVTIIIPVYNGGSTLEEVFESLEHQNNKELIKEIIVVYDVSTDNGLSIINNYQLKSSYKVRVLDGQRGLSKNYNFGIKQTTSSYFIIMHQDVVLPDFDSFKKALTPCFNNDKVVATGPLLYHSRKSFDSYSFWQKTQFARFVEKKIESFNGKFDCYNKNVLLDKIGFFNEDNYRTAGEDGDMMARIENAGFSIVNSGVIADHIHSREGNFSYKKVIKKEAQLNEAYGVHFAMGNIKSLKSFILCFFRLFLVLGLLPPYFRTISIVLIIIYSYLYTKLVYETEYKDKRIFILPFFNIMLLFVGSFYNIKGFITKKEKI